MDTARDPFSQLPVKEVMPALLKAYSRTGKAGGPDQPRSPQNTTQPPPVRILLSAPTGSGKSTAVPSALLDAAAAEQKEHPGLILVVQPRRIAAIMLAQYLAQIRGGPVGQEVGYQVRFNSKRGDATQLIYLTDGLLQRMLADNPLLKGIQTIVFDEFHERRLASDVSLARILDLQEAQRPDLRLLVMSATLETTTLQEYLGESQRLTAGGRTYPVTVNYEPPKDAGRDRNGRPILESPWDQISRICRRELPTLQDTPGAKVLVFLPGAHEIRKTISTLEACSWIRGWDLRPLYTNLPPSQQRAALANDGQHRIIVSTNVAETSLTIEGVRLVIDSGLARIANYDARRGLNTLNIRKISQAAAQQRAGRAGRTAPGHCFRLWSETDHAKRSPFDEPEVARLDLTEVVLYLKTLGIADLATFRWLTPPPTDSLNRAAQLLFDLGAVDAAGSLTEAGREMARWPLHPREARLLLAAAEENCVAEAAFAAAVCQGEGVFASGRGSSRQQRERFQVHERHQIDFTDFAAAWRACNLAQSAGFRAEKLRGLGIHGQRAREIWRIFSQLLEIAEVRGLPVGRADFDQRDESLARALLVANADRLAIKLSAGTNACQVRAGRRGKLDESSIAKQGRLLIATEMTEIEGREVTVHLRHAARLRPEWLPELLPHEINITEGARYDEHRRAVDLLRQVRIDDLVISEEESSQGGGDAQAAELLATKVQEGELILKSWDAKVNSWIARVNFLAELMPELDISPFTKSDAQLALEQLCLGARSYREIKNRDLWPILQDWLAPPQQQALEHFAPRRIKLDHSREAKITWPRDSEPYVALKVQQLFGIQEAPLIANGQHRVLIHILAPNHRPWQMTKDLPNFWKNGYQQMKKDLAGRYPKHNWPEPEELA